MKIVMRTFAAFALLIVFLLGTTSVARSDDLSDGRDFLFNGGIFTYSGIQDANAKFKTAVDTAPSNQEANLFYAITRVLTFALEEGSEEGIENLRELLEAFGMTRNGNNNVESGMPYDPPPETPDGNYILPATTPTGGEVRAFLGGPFIEILDAAIGNLDQVTNTFKTTLGAAETGDSAVEVDYGDVLLYKATLYFIKSYALMISAYNMDMDIKSLINIIDMEIFQIQRDLLDNYENLLKLREDGGATSLTDAGDALINTIDAYSGALNAIAKESEDGDGQDDELFSFGSEIEETDATTLLNGLMELKTSLDENRNATFTEEKWIGTIDAGIGLIPVEMTIIKNMNGDFVTGTFGNDSGKVTQYDVNGQNVTIKGVIDMGLSILHFKFTGTIDGDQITTDQGFNPKRIRTQEFSGDLNLVYGNTGKAPLDIRGILPLLNQYDEIIAGTFPGNPVLNGIFPDFKTNEDLLDVLDMNHIQRAGIFSEHRYFPDFTYESYIMIGYIQAASTNCNTYINNIPDTGGDVELNHISGWDDFTPNLYVNGWESPVPGAQWEDRSYMLYVDKNPNGFYDEDDDEYHYYLPPGAIEQVDIVENVDIYGNIHPIITWDAVDQESVDLYLVRFFPVTEDGETSIPDLTDLLFQSEQIPTGLPLSFVYTGDLFEEHETLAIVIEAVDLDAGAQIANRSRYIIKYTGDLCFTDPLKTDPGECGCGIPDTDTDRDGILDCNDPDDNTSVDLSGLTNADLTGVDLEDRDQLATALGFNGVNIDDPDELADAVNQKCNTAFTGDDVKIGDDGNIQVMLTTGIKVDGIIPIRTTIASQGGDVVINAVMEPGTIVTSNGAEYTGTINPPQQVQLSEIPDTIPEEDIADLGASPVIFEMGNPNQDLELSVPMYVEIQVILPNSVGNPTIYYVNEAAESLDPAGENGMHNGVNIDKGGTILDSQENSPTAGSTTHTIGLLLRHMSQFVAGELLADSPTGPPPNGGNGGDNGGGGGDGGGCFISLELDFL